MTAQASARKPVRVHCPEPGCTYSMDNAGSIPAHLAMAHKVEHVGRRPEDELACIGSNHVPFRGHFPAAPEVPPASGAAAPAAIPPAAGANLLDLAIDLVDVGDNVRVAIEDLEELAASIEEHGVLQPIKATGPHADGRYLVIWGQRRTLASRMAGRTTIPAIVLPPDAAVDAHGPARAIEQLVENLHRADLNPIDRARSMRAVVDSGVTQADLARKLGIAPSTVSNDLRLLTLADDVVERIRTGEITASHGKAIASLPAKQQAQVARSITERGLSSHGLELELQWRQDEAKADAERAKRTARHLPKIVAALVAAGVPKGAEIYIALNSYSFDVAAIEATVADAGWTQTGRRYRMPRQGECGCQSVQLATRGSAVVVEPTCSDDAHQGKAKKRDTVAEDKARAEYEGRLLEIRDEIERHLVAAALPVAILRILSASLAVNYSEDFPNAGEAAARALAGELVRQWRVREMATPALLAELQADR